MKLLISILLGLVSADQILAPSNELAQVQIEARDKVIIETIETDKAPAPIGPYSQAKKVTGGTTIYVAGQIGMDLNGHLVGGDISDQTS